jgi:KipI family sensor histidine kinase inhibitor
VRTVGEYSWLLSFGDADERRANERARFAAALLRSRAPEGLVEAVPAARTLFVEGGPAFDAGILAGLEAEGEEPPPAAYREHRIHVRAGGEDVPEVCALLGLTESAFWEAFLAPTFTVGFLGFAPGFAYLYGLPRSLRLPRRMTPRLRVPACSLAMAGPYVGIYPGAMPGGWNLLGTAEGDFFDASRRPPVLLAPGDTVRFTG